MRRSALVSLAVFASACSDTAEMKAWREHKAALSAEVAKLKALDSDRTTAQAKFDVAQPEWVRVQASLDVIATARDLDAGVRAFQDERGVSLAFEGSLEGCRDALTALGDARKLTPAWRVRIDPDGTCRWQALEAPALHTFHLGDAPPLWAPPLSELTSRGIGALRDEVKALETEKRTLSASLGALSLLPELDARVLQGKDVFDALTRAPPPCDLAVVTRALELNLRGLLEVSSVTLVHPIRPEDDARTKGLATRLPDGPLIWSCEARTP